MMFNSYTGRSNGFRSEMVQNTSSIVTQRSLPNLKAAQMKEHTLCNSAGLESVDRQAEI